MAGSVKTARSLTLTIAFPSKRYSSGWEEVLGHCCNSDDEVRTYVKTLGGALRAVPLDFDFGTFVGERTTD